MNVTFAVTLEPLLTKHIPLSVHPKKSTVVIVRGYESIIRQTRLEM